MDEVLIPLELRRRRRRRRSSSFTVLNPKQNERNTEGKKNGTKHHVPFLGLIRGQKGGETQGSDISTDV